MQLFIRYTLGLLALICLQSTAKAQIYASQGSTNTGFYYYNISANTWTALAPIPSDDAQYGLSSDGVNVYAIGYKNGAGGYKTYRYTPVGNTWSELAGLAVPPLYVSGPVSTSAGQKFYVFDRTFIGCTDPRSCRTASIYRYDIAANTYTNVINYPLSTDGSVGLVSSGNGLYMLSTPGTGLFYYDETTSTLIAKAGAPGALEYNGNATSDGSYIYAVAGNGPDPDGYARYIYRYSIATNSWITLPNKAPGQIRGYMTTDGTNLYASAGAGSSVIYRYTINTGVWSTIAPTPGVIQSGPGHPVAFPSGGLLYVGCNPALATCLPITVSKKR